MSVEDRARRLVGDLRISGSVLRGTRTETLPFPCHPQEQAFLADFDPARPVQYWEHPCGRKGCGTVYRFEHTGRQIRWEPIAGLTHPEAPHALPLNGDEVDRRLRREQGKRPASPTADARLRKVRRSDPIPSLQR